MSQYEMPRASLPDPASLKFKVGDRIRHKYGNYPEGHGPGMILRLNDNTEGLYLSARYPYSVLFDNGYVDYYAERDLVSE